MRSPTALGLKCIEAELEEELCVLEKEQFIMLLDGGECEKELRKEQLSLVVQSRVLLHFFEELCEHDVQKPGVVVLALLKYAFKCILEHVSEMQGICVTAFEQFGAG